MLLQPIRYLVWLLGRVVLALRYWVRVVGKDEVFRQPGPYLILPNHPAYADPPNILARLWPSFQMRPLLLESNFQNPVLGPIGFLLRAIKVPDLSAASAVARERAEGAVAAAIDALKAGENVILWPSGRLSRDGIERLGGARAVSDILAAAPNVTVVLVRTRGLWGSCFSWADAVQPEMMRNLLTSPLTLLANFVFFAPRRRVTMTLEAFPPGTRPEPTRETINPWLEAWYNASPSPEPPTFVPYHFLFGPRTHDYPPPVTLLSDESGGGDAKTETKKAVADLLAEKLKRPLAEDENRPDTTFFALGIDSLDAMDVALTAEQRFGFSAGMVPTTVGQLWAVAEGRAEAGPLKPPPDVWFSPPTGQTSIEILGETVATALLARVLRNPKDVAAADDMSGVLTYERVLLGALVLAKRFRDIPGANVGLMLPASAAGMITLLALHLAGKLPVILNWTTGPANLEHAVKLLGVTRVVTSRKFLDRLQIAVPGANFVYLEDVRGGVGKLELLWRLAAVSLFRGTVVKRALAALDPDPQKPAVVLFTSGSEKAPKAVPLTHANVIADLRGAIPLLDLDRFHRVIVFLPLFHSFGHTVTGLLPLFAGVRAVYHPDPTDANGLARKAAAYRATALAATPTFLGYMLDRAAPGDLDDLRVAVVGAEKCPEAVFAKARELAPHAVVMEGYGITECSPVVSVNPRADTRHGTIGKPLVGVEVCVCDLETNAVLPTGQMGMLHVAGPIIFPGYIGHDGPSPFREMNGKKWYVTGDLAELDADGYIVFHGRLKRFLKAGGEMISLPALEAPFAKLYPPTDAGPRVAVEGVETDAGRRVVLFTTEEISLKDANAALQKEGLRGVMRLDEVRKIDAIPVLGTGKTDYKVLRAQIQ
ncbi:AMP-binding protein [Fimbriiglobus ruber]|uniref:2-acylglycerophosphoethanolamine acyltransferase n=1 Tax=Fimbriiglobus ruber TaxID=1908690 RepID=A0A225DMB7_9BACT|nr:AMP-binding protein [Fimbriiglobus ruber]OWK38369.1 2-acylglycerophosphoethanolamine acyltransferase [Fimbriiglobus ruber]